MQTPAPAPTWSALPAFRTLWHRPRRLITLPSKSEMADSDSGLRASITITMCHVLLDPMPLTLELMTVLMEVMRSAVARDPVLSGFFRVLLIFVHLVLARAGASTATAAAPLSPPAHPIPHGDCAEPVATVSMGGTTRVFDGRRPLAAQESEATGHSSSTWRCAAIVLLLRAPSSSAVRSSLHIWPIALGPLPRTASTRSGRPRLPALSPTGFYLFAALARALSRMRRGTREEEGVNEEGEESSWEGVGISISLLASMLMETPIPPGPPLTSASTTVRVPPHITGYDLQEGGLRGAAGVLDFLLPSLLSGRTPAARLVTKSDMMFSAAVVCVAGVLVPTRSAGTHTTHAVSTDSGEVMSRGAELAEGDRMWMGGERLWERGSSHATFRISARQVTLFMLTLARRGKGGAPPLAIAPLATSPRYTSPPFSFVGALCVFIAPWRTTRW